VQIAPDDIALISQRRIMTIEGGPILAPRRIRIVTHNKSKNLTFHTLAAELAFIHLRALCTRAVVMPALGAPQLAPTSREPQRQLIHRELAEQLQIAIFAALLFLAVAAGLAILVWQFGPDAQTAARRASIVKGSAYAILSLIVSLTLSHAAATFVNRYRVADQTLDEGGGATKVRFLARQARFSRT
jgi:hypothetical protein